MSSAVRHLSQPPLPPRQGRMEGLVLHVWSEVGSESMGSCFKGMVWNGIRCLVLIDGGALAEAGWSNRGLHLCRSDVGVEI
ncbi:hypothetical protein CRG98_001385 [Punica granatum]|uniref:Uncharacterized protein n=1 Tax=Punica granatum TaxID=22663 RepID=A0A2I0LC10_PUNGR|nr:hypothetical protein CRG98_001385 [Punica granatum]